ncbi:MAG: ATP-dependent DNA helicase RecG, partial [Bacteroidota bacterium]
MNPLDKEIKFLQGVGPKRADILKKELQLETLRDLIYYFPYKYIDRSKIYQIREISSTSSHIQVKGKITSFSLVGQKFKQRLVANFSDG